MAGIVAKGREVYRRAAPAVRTARTAYRIARAVSNPRFPGGRVTYGDYARTGKQDCENVIDIDQFEIRPGKSARQIVDATFAGFEEDGLRDTWMEQNARDVRGNQLDPDEAYEAWKSGWKGRAVTFVEDQMKHHRRNGSGSGIYLVGQDREGDTYAVEVDEIATTDEARTEQLYDLLELMMLDRKGSYRAWYVHADDAGWARLEKKKEQPFSFTYPLRHLKNPRGSARTGPSLHWAIRDGMARALWVSSYADWVDNIEEDRKRKRLSPGPGGDWDDVAPPTPKSAEDAAERLETLFYNANGLTTLELLERARKADGIRAASDEYAELFGHYLAMEALGHGVSWFDDHESFEITWPFHFEAHTFDGKKLTWSGRAR